LRDIGFYGCRVSQGKITFSCDCEKARGISKQLDALGVPYELDVVGVAYYVKKLFSRFGILVGVFGALLLNGFFSDMQMDDLVFPDVKMLGCQLHKPV
jgi:hypothetical protein